MAENKLIELADTLNEVASEILQWAASPANGGPFSEETYRTNCQVSGTLLLIAERIREKAR